MHTHFAPHWTASLPDPRKPYEIRRIGGGQDLAVQLDEMLLDLRIDSEDENLTVSRLIGGMTDYFGARSGWCLTPMDWELLVSPGCAEITVERGPFRELLGCWTWNHTTRAWDEVDLADLVVIERGREFDLLFPDAVANCFHPSAATTRSVRLQFSAGFDSPEVSDTDVKGPPEDGMIVSLKALVAHMYENREAGGANGSWTGANPALDFLLGSYRKFW